MSTDALIFISQYQQLVTTCGITSIPTSGPFTTPNLPVTPTLPPIGKRETDDDEEEDEEERRTFSDAREMLGLYEGIFDYGMWKLIYS